MYIICISYGPCCMLTGQPSSMLTPSNVSWMTLWQSDRSAESHSPALSLLMRRLAYETVLVTWVSNETGSRKSQHFECIPGSSLVPEITPVCRYSAFSNMSSYAPSVGVCANDSRARSRWRPHAVCLQQSIFRCQHAHAYVAKPLSAPPESRADLSTGLAAAC